MRGAVLPYPFGELVLRDVPLRQRQYFGDDFGIGGAQTPTIQAKERHDGQKAYALVSISVRVVSDQAEAVGGGKRREVSLVIVMPLLLRPCQCGLQGVLVTDTW